MKSAYELAMERLQESDPNGSIQLTDEQKAQLAEIDKKFAAKVAEREIFLQKQLAEAQQKRDANEAAQIEKQLISERDRLEEEREDAKNKVRSQAKT